MFTKHVWQQCKLLLLYNQEHCTDQVTITLMTTLLPDWATFIFPLKEIVKLGYSYRFRKLF